MAVVGLGESGRAAARLALERGGEVYVSDVEADPGKEAAARELRALGASVEVGEHDLARIFDAGVVVASPGIPPNAPVLRALRERGRGWISEPEFAFRFFQGPLIAVTGTNGKTTTAALVAHLLEEGGIHVGLGGNIGAGLGPPASDLARRDPPPQWYVLELSSFQLAGIDALTPDIGVVTNLAPDHLDRYASVEEYYADKANLFRNAATGSRWVLNGDQPEVGELAGDAPGARYWARETWANREVPGAFVAEGRIHLRLEDRADVPPLELLPVSELSLLGRHNRANAVMAAVTAALAGVEPPELRTGLRTFRPLPHRMEPVVERDGVLWVNDSKATNLHAVQGSLAAAERPVILLLGGKDKGEPFRDLMPVLKDVRAVLAFGEARERIGTELADWGPVHPVKGDLEEAVDRARQEARPGDMVLLAPGCSSFDRFSGYEERGARFRTLVEEAT